MNNNEHDILGEIPRQELLNLLDSELRRPGLADGVGMSQASLPQAPGPVACTVKCPPLASYLQLATHAMENSEAERLLTHAAECGRCGDVLARSLSALEGNPSPEEAAAITKLAAARMDWQRDLARELAATKAARPNRHPHTTLWISAAVAAMLVLAAGVFAWQQQRNTPERQLAMAYEQSRTLELRVPDAGYAELTAASHTRGVGTESEPSALFEAKATLARELKQSPLDAHWLQLQARADVLQEHYASAADVLDRLVAQGPVTAELLADAATAYYQRGLIVGSELDRSTALDYLRRADELAPADPVILFNEAIVMEDRGQMMNAVEVWNRFITVERDPKWAAEGKRKLSALEQTLNRLRSHQSRIDGMLATPKAMDALAGNAEQLAAIDEELSTYDLAALFHAAFPVSGPSTQEAGFTGAVARGSPCNESCGSARKLLKNLGNSLELQHHDFWFSDLLAPDPDSLPPATLQIYAQALQSLGEAARDNEIGFPLEGERKAQQAGKLFQQLATMGPSSPSLAIAAAAGEQRSLVASMYALQRRGDHRDCRDTAAQLDAQPEARRLLDRYPWIETSERITEFVCSDTEETRVRGRLLLAQAERLAETHRYGLLSARIDLMRADDFQDAGDNEAAERLDLAIFRRLVAEDAPTLRIANTVSSIEYMEDGSPRLHVVELCLREMVRWWELAGDQNTETAVRMALARVEIRIGALEEAQRQLRLAKTENDTVAHSGKSGANLVEDDVSMASALLERGNLAEAGHYLDEASAYLPNYSDTWGLRAYAMARGQLELAQGHLDQAAQALELEIRGSEGKNVHKGDRATAVEYARQDHDLYAELAATWLAQGRTPESVLALWERFRLRSRGLPIQQCEKGALDCEQASLKEAEGGLGESVLIGQIILLDRVLLYRMDRTGVTWTQINFRRQDVLDSADLLDRAVSSPYTTQAAADRLGSKLSGALLQSLPPSLPQDATLLLEPDPMLENLAWPVLSTSAGPLGLQYALAEVRSILAVNAHQSGASIRETAFNFEAQNGKRALVVGASIAAGDQTPLPEALQEATNVSRFLHSPEVLLGNAANASNVATSLPTAAIFHFAGHAAQTVDGTRLLLAGSPNDPHPWVDGAFLRQHPPRACRLAVLSACATGKLEASWNHPMQNIVETFASLGVPEVVATRWQIDSKASVSFSDAFYSNLAKGESVALALTSARRVQFGQSTLSNPYYWGAYYLTSARKTGPIGATRAHVKESAKS